MKTIGIIGGFSPEATAKFYLELICQSRLKGASSQPNIIVWNVPVPRSFEMSLLLHGKDVRSIVKDVIHAARQLEKAGVDMVVLPCNTLHVLEADIRNSIKIPFISIVDIVKRHVKKEGLNRIGILSSLLTNTSGLFEKNDIDVIPPAKSAQNTLNKALFDSVTATNVDDLRQALGVCLGDLKKKGIHDVLVACTDFSGMCPEIADMHLYDTLTLLAREITDKST